MKSSSLRRAGLLAALMTAGLIRAEDEPARDREPVEPGVKWLQTYFADAASRYEFYHDVGRSQRLQLVDRAVFHWKQDDDWRGDLFVWTYEGQPEILGCVLASNPSGTARNVFHEFHALAEKPLPPVDTPHVHWAPTNGLPRQAVPDAPPAAGADALRLAQLRALARSFTVAMEVDGKPWQLRLLPQPIYRYSAPEQGVVDGALFTYVWTKGTDPEFVLLLECRRAGSKSEWVYSPLRMTNRPLSLSYDDREVWTCPSIAGVVTPESPYVTFYSETITVPEDSR